MGRGTGAKKSRDPLRLLGIPVFTSTPAAGLEPATRWLTATCSTN
jgi:hypothetical protein